ncbi:hypothetical protein KO361_03665 [Candidatus Woesearchaeota archaeon]|nr:hypothetical protein [Candidatus Woesearchaeota archaeon]
MNVIKEYEKLTQNIEYKKFMRNNKEYYLVHILVPENEQELEIGYYNPRTDKITIFKTNPITKQKEEDIFKEGKTIQQLEIKKIKINYEEATQKTNEILKKEHSAELVNKKIIILQHIMEPVWNMTFICKSMNIINIRINAETGQIIRNNKASLLDMAGMMKGNKQ